jgi:hypothetical protein
VNARGHFGDIFDELDRNESALRARLKKCAKLHSIHPQGLPRFLNKKRQEESAPGLQVALYSRLNARVPDQRLSK